MAKSPQLDEVLRIYKEFGEKAGQVSTIDELRALTVDFLAPFPPADDVKREPVDAGGVPGEWIIPPGAANDKVLFYLHGGGHVFASADTHAGMASRIARAAGVRALATNYRLAPENPFPAGLEDAMKTYRWLLAQGYQSKNIAIAGDSSAGGLTLSTLVALRYFGEPLPACGVPLSPWTDLEGIGESMTTNKELDPFVQRETIQFLAPMFVGDRDLRTPLAAPLYADMTGLPPLLIQVGGTETMLDDATRMADRAKAAGVDVTLEVWEDMVHDWQIFAPILPEGQQAIDRIGEFIRKNMS